MRSEVSNVRVSVYSIFVKLDFSFHFTIHIQNFVLTIEEFPLYLCNLPISIWQLFDIIIPYLLKLDLYYVQGLQCIFEGWTDGQSGSVTQMENGDNWHLDSQSIIFMILLPTIKWNRQNLLMLSKIRLSINLNKALKNQHDLVNQGRNKSSPLTFSLRSVSPWDCPVILVGGLPDLSIVLSCDRLSEVNEENMWLWSQLLDYWEATCSWCSWMVGWALD